MNPEQPIGRLMTLSEATTYFERVAAAEKVMGPLSVEERIVILGTIGKEVTAEDVQEMIKDKKVLRIMGDNNAKDC